LRLSGRIAPVLVLGFALAPGSALRAWADEGAAPASEGAPPASEAAEPFEAAPRRREVALEVAAADARDSDALTQVARELLGRLGLEVRASLVARVDLAAILAPPRPGGAPETGLARVWIDWRTPGRATLYLLDAHRDRLLVRQVERPAGGDELAREELGHILETACEGLLAGEEVGEPRAGVAPRLLAPPTTVVATAPPEGEGSLRVLPEFGPSRVQLALLWEAAGFASEAHLTQGPEASLFVGQRPRFVRGSRWGLWGTAQLRLPVHAADDTGAGVELEAGALRALLAYERPWSERVTGRAGLGGGVDVVHARPEAATPDVAVLGPAFTRAFAVARAAIALDLRLAGSTWLVAALAADVDVTGQGYAFGRGGGGEELVLKPWVVRPAAALGLAFP
jgi:hypothetical protein